MNLRTLPPCLLLLLLPAAACSSDRSPCSVPGVVQTCTCGSGMHGARVCSADKTWQACDCSGLIALPKAIADKPTMHGSGGSGSGGRGSTPNAPGSGGMSAPEPGTDDDAGAVRDAGGTGGMGAHPDAGGTGGAPSDAGMPEPTNPYGACMTAADCLPGSMCIITPSTPADATVCAPPCVDTGDCPVPAGSYEAVLACVTGFCQLDCTPVLFAPLLTCPTGMTCVAPAFSESYCHDDGM